MFGKKKKKKVIKKELAEDICVKKLEQEILNQKDRFEKDISLINEKLEKIKSIKKELKFNIFLKKIILYLGYLDSKILDHYTNIPRSTFQRRGYLDETEKLKSKKEMLLKILWVNIDSEKEEVK